MKIFKLFVLAVVLLFAGASQAQISVRFNIGLPPSWGPEGYTDVRYYYLPDVQAYYDVPSSMFIYFEGGYWVRRSYLPSRYRNYDLYHGYKVVMNDYHGNTPYRYFDQHKRYYAKGYHNGYQRTNGDRPQYGNKYDNNQVNRGRNDHNSYNRDRDDQSYDKHGKEKSNQGNRSYNNNNGNDNNNSHKSNNGNKGNK